MRPRVVISVLATAFLATINSSAAAAVASNASFVTTVSLEWVDRQAYVATVQVDGVDTRLQIGTMYPYAWVACGLESPTKTGQCRTGVCEFAVYAETNRYCATQRAASFMLLSSNDSGPNFSASNLPLRVAQYQNITELNDTRVYIPPAMKPDYSDEQPRLVNGAQGTFGLGRGSVTSFKAMNSLLRSFSLYVTRDQDNSLLLLDVGPLDEPSESFNPSLVAANAWSASYTVPVRDASGEKEDDQAEAAFRWDLGLVAVRFDEDQPLYPREYTWSEEAGGDAAASLSLNDAVIGMPTNMFNAFRSKYLSSCLLRGQNAVGNHYVTCAVSLQDSLPRITLYLGNHSFFLDPEDYTHPVPNNASAIVVELEASSNSAHWILGAPFLRKFPTRFSAVSQDVMLFCTAGVTCRPQSFGTLGRTFLEEQPSDWKVQSSSGDHDPARNTSRYPYTPSPSPYVFSSYRDPSPLLLAAIWLGRALAVLILFVVLIQTVASCRDRLLGRRRGQPQNLPDDTGTVASERDIEETKIELRAMAAAEEARTQRRGTQTLVDDSATDYMMIQSPHHDMLDRQRQQTEPRS